MKPLILRKFQRNLRDYGWGIALRKSAETCLRLFYEGRAYRVYRMDLRTWRPQVPAGDGLAYRLIGSQDHDLITQIEALEDWLQDSIDQRLAAGALCLVALDGRTVAGFNLVSFGRVSVPLIDSCWTFGPHCAWSEQITVNPDYRGRGIATELRHRIIVELKSRDVRRFYGGALAFNTASLNLTRKVGFREIVEVRFRKLLGHSSRRYVRLLP